MSRCWGQVVGVGHEAGVYPHPPPQLSAPGRTSRSCLRAGRSRRCSSRCGGEKYGPALGSGSQQMARPAAGAARLRGQPSQPSLVRDSHRPTRAQCFWRVTSALPPRAETRRQRRKTSMGLRFSLMGWHSTGGGCRGNKEEVGGRVQQRGGARAQLFLFWHHAASESPQDQAPTPSCPGPGSA